MGLRRFQLYRRDVNEAASRIGYTPGCPGCRAAQHGFNSRPMHTEPCRQRMEKEIATTTRGRRQMENYETKLSREVEKQIERDKKAARVEEERDRDSYPLAQPAQDQNSVSQ